MATTVTGTTGNDSWTVVNPGTFTLDGLGGTDTLNLGTSARSTYRITQGSDGSVHVDSVSGASGGGLHATLYNIEILTFNSGRDKLDLTTYFGGGGGTGTDTAAPTLTAASPADEASGVALSANIELTFSETVQRGSGTIAITDASGATVASYDVATSSNLTFSGSTLTINPTGNFAYGALLKLDVPSGAVNDSAGNSFAGLSGYEFTTTSVYTGSSGNDTITLPAGVSTVNAGAGLDKVVLGQASTAYQLKTTTSGATLTSSSGTLTLNSVERLQYSDHQLALDLKGNAGEVAKVLGAVFGADAVHNAAAVGIGLDLRDNGYSYEGLMQLALQARLGTNATSSDVVTLLFNNVVGVTPSASDLAALSGLLDSHAMTPAALAVVAADLSLNTDHIDLAGLQTTGLIYT